MFDDFCFFSLGSNYFECGMWCGVVWYGVVWYVKAMRFEYGEALGENVP
jgi:hypothetical protein